MKIAIIGTGYVGIVTGVCLAEINHRVICVDKNQEKINILRSGKVDIYEPSLEEYLERNIANKNISFTTNSAEAIEKSDLIFIAVGTPEKPDGTVNLDYLNKVVETIKTHINGYKIIVNKSTVPIGTGQRVKEILATAGKPFDVVSNPEFLKEGTSINDFMKPDRIVVGCESDSAYDAMVELYSPLVLNGHPIIRMNLESAELTKYASNAFLATKISFMNEISRLSEKVGADISLVRQGMTKDKRIGDQFLYPGIGYGGSCFPKDVQGLIHQSKNQGLSAKILQSVHEVNEEQRLFFLEKIFTHFKNDFKKLHSMHFAIWGLAFKPETDDIRNAPALTVIDKLLEHGIIIRVHDPKSMEHVKALYGEKLIYSKDQYTALEGADALILCTEWGIYRNPDFNKMSELMNAKVIFDGRNQLKAKSSKHGFKWYGIGLNG